MRPGPRILKKRIRGFGSVLTADSSESLLGFLLEAERVGPADDLAALLFLVLVDLGKVQSGQGSMISLVRKQYHSISIPLCISPEF
jgi:hypothetical protein